MLDDKVILINKPPGLTSHEVSTLVRKITGASRAGHAGTLDPEVSGVLPVAIGRATKLLRYIAGKDKTYVGIMKFKIPQSKEQIEALFAKFTGELVQTPPKISAVRKVPRKRTVHYLKLLEVKGRLALFETKVDAGTYIRTLCEDMGAVCGGARMEELRRTAVGKITERETHTMYDLVDAVWLHRQGRSDELRKMLVAPEKLIDLPRARIKESALKSVQSGAQLMMPAMESMPSSGKGSRVAIYCGGRFVGIGIVQVDEKDMHTRGIAVKIERMHIPPGG
ncbi:MAG TPA: RNA-guided pseudouridylation complex pseudouridine synthase subunit Cbf5 [Candidatus Bilamarchaeum sp.]|nr:RNA-guided pseudouridylation complex pseudouridine synthase subunit Cbf5 [Candidatus Bilamarchaeum sp.]